MSLPRSHPTQWYGWILYLQICLNGQFQQWNSGPAQIIYYTQGFMMEQEIYSKTMRKWWAWGQVLRFEDERGRVAAFKEHTQSGGCFRHVNRWIASQGINCEWTMRSQMGKVYLPGCVHGISTCNYSLSAHTWAFASSVFCGPLECLFDRLQTQISLLSKLFALMTDLNFCLSPQYPVSTLLFDSVL